MKKYSYSKTKNEIGKIRRNGFLEKLSDSKLAKLQQIGSRVADLEFKTYSQLALIFISRKQGGKILGGVQPVTRLEQIITPKLSMMIHNREGKKIVTQQEKVTNGTRLQMNNLFQRLYSSLRGRLLKRKGK